MHFLTELSDFIGVSSGFGIFYILTASVKNFCIYIKGIRNTYRTMKKKIKLQRKIKLLAIPAIIINSMLTGMATTQANTSRGYTQTCTNIIYKAGYLAATCRTKDGAYRKSDIDLNNYITNKDGTLMWGREGNFADSSNCEVVVNNDSISNLYCYTRAVDGTKKLDTLNLDAHIENINGWLQYY